MEIDSFITSSLVVKIELISTTIRPAKYCKHSYQPGRQLTSSQIGGASKQAFAFRKMLQMIARGGLISRNAWREVEIMYIIEQCVSITMGRRSLAMLRYAYLWQQK